MKKAYLSLLIVLLCLSMFGCADRNGDGHVNKGDAVAVFVNGEPIYETDIKKVIEYNAEAKYEQVLSDTIDDTLLFQYGIAHGISVSENEVDERLLEIKTSVPDIYKDIEESANFEKYKVNLKKIMIISKVKEAYLKEHDAQLHISDKEISSWYEEKLNKPFPGTDIVKESVYNTLYEEKCNALIESFIAELKANAEIIFERSE